MRGDDDHNLATSPKRLLWLLFVSYLAGFAAIPHTDYSDTAAGIWSPIILASIPAIVVALVIWATIRQSDPARFRMLSYPIGSAVTAVGFFFFWLRRDYLIKDGVPEDEATKYVMLSLTGLTLAVGIALLCVTTFKRRKENNAQN